MVILEVEGHPLAVWELNAGQQDCSTRTLPMQTAHRYKTGNLCKMPMIEKQADTHTQAHCTR